MDEEKKKNKLSDLKGKDRKWMFVALSVYTFGLIGVILFATYITIFYTFFDFLVIVVFMFLYFGPSALTNASMVFLGGGKPIDGGRNFIDGKRLFGDHKTWNGAIKGSLFSVSTCYVVALIFIFIWRVIESGIVWAIDNEFYTLFTEINVYKFYFIGGQYPMNFFYGLIRLLLLSFGAPVGDLIGSFTKRRLNIKDGDPFLVVDQTDFLVGALIMIALPTILFPSIFLIHWEVVIFGFISMLALNIANLYSFRCGKKDVPW